MGKWRKREKEEVRRIAIKLETRCQLLCRNYETGYGDIKILLIPSKGEGKRGGLLCPLLVFTKLVAMSYRGLFHLRGFSGSNASTIFFIPYSPPQFFSPV